MQVIASNSLSRQGKRSASKSARLKSVPGGYVSGVPAKSEAAKERSGLSSKKCRKVCPSELPRSSRFPPAGTSATNFARVSIHAIRRQYRQFKDSVSAGHDARY